MKKLFISQPMRGLSDDEIISVREKASAIMKEDCTVLDSFFQGAPAESKPLWYLGKSLQVLSEADVAYFASGWENARGCKIEHLCAEQYGIEIIEEASNG